MIGTTLAHYRILELLGTGGMGSVYRAHDTRLGRDIALKVLPPDHLDDPVLQARLVREARTASQLNHPNVCVVHEVGEVEGVVYVAMELVDGRPLKELIPPGGLPVESVLRFGAQIADALAHAHEHGVIHRDLKSANVVVTPGNRAKVLDFGIARMLEEFSDTTTRRNVTLTESGSLVGTPSVMAPEMLQGGKGDVRSDLWSLGVVLYELTSGRLPFGGRTVAEVCAAILARPMEPLPAGVPPRLKALIEACLEKDVTRRIGSATDVGAELEAIRIGRANGNGAAPRPRWPLTALLLILLVGAGLYFALRPRPPASGPPVARQRALAVLPLESLSADPAQRFFADGMTEELIGNLGRIGDLRVISRNSVMRYRDSTRPLEEIAGELGVDLIVTGSVLPGADSVRIRAHLVQVDPERQLWSAGYTRASGQVLALQNEVALDIAGRISLQLTPVEQARLARAAPVNPRAYEEYLRGRFHWNERTPEGMRRAIQAYRRALAIEPGLAVAHAGLAYAYARLSLYTGQAPRETYPAAREAAETALRLDPGLADAHASLAAVSLFYDRDWPRAKVEFLRAIELGPSHATAHHWYSIWLRDMGDFPGARSAATRALELDPLSPILKVNRADTEYYARRFEQAIALHQDVLATDPEFAPAHLYLGLAYDQAGKAGPAVASLERARALSGNEAYALGPLGYVQARAGHAAAARAVRGELVAMQARGLAVAYDVALVHVGLGEKAAALDWLERADDERAALNDLAVDPKFDPLRTEPRFVALLARLGLPGRPVRSGGSDPPGP